MSRKLIDCFFPILMSIAFAALSPVALMGGDPVSNRSIVPVTDFPSQQSFAYDSDARPSECCPIHWRSIDCEQSFAGGTHDSMPVFRTARLTVQQPIQRSTQRSIQESDQQTADSNQISIPTAIFSLASVRVQQFAEPFATVGPRLIPTGKQLTEFLDWCNDLSIAESSVTEPASNQMALDPVPTIQQIVSLDLLLASLSADEPIDVRKNYVEIAGYRPSIDVAKIDPRVGSSPVIATLSQAPFAAVAERHADDNGAIQIWSVFPVVTRPFCLRHQSGDLDLNPSLRVLPAFDDSDRMATLGDIDHMLADARSTISAPAKQAVPTDLIGELAKSISLAESVVDQVSEWSRNEEAAGKQRAWESIQQFASESIDRQQDFTAECWQSGRNVESNRREISIPTSNHAGKKNAWAARTCGRSNSEGGDRSRSPVEVRLIEDCPR